MASIEAPTPLRCVPYIDYLVLFRKDSVGLVSPMIDSGSNINTMHSAYAKKLDFNIRKTDVGVQKIYVTTLEIFGMVIAVFSVHDRTRKVCFFKQTFLLANISIDVALGMSFLILSNADIRFTNRKLYWRSYSVSEVLPIICCLKLIDQKEFTVVTLGKNNKTFVVHMASLAVSTEITIDLSRIAQIALLIADKAFVIVPTEYSDFAEIFLPYSTVELLKHTGIHDHPIELINN